MPADHRPDTRLGVVLGTIAVAAVVAPTIWAWTQADRLPDQIVRHWGTGGTPTAAWDLSSHTIYTAVLTLLMVAVPALVAVLGRPPRVVRQCLAGMAAWMAVFLGAMGADITRVHLDVSDPMTVMSPSLGIALGVLGGLIAAPLAARTVRKDPPHPPVTAPPRADLPRSSHTDDAPRWRGTAPPSPALMGTAAAVIVLLGALSLVAGWPILVIALALAGLMAVMARFTVTVDDRGLTVRTPVSGLLHVPLEEIAEAAVIDDVNPFWEFGGWGLRVTLQGRTGVVSRRGEALSIRRADDSEVVVTIDDAREAAATLNTLVDRRLGPSAGGNVRT